MLAHQKRNGSLDSTGHALDTRTAGKDCAVLQRSPVWRGRRTATRRLPGGFGRGRDPYEDGRSPATDRSQSCGVLLRTESRNKGLT
jgi:hypothetical protein